ncbi:MULTISPECIES: Stk1 family PASTA domain-containing Ser/Thr kinase [unclassified Microbacterium]|uniref:Stk1 family PASTA domain-containing Ser/Thr kinase n=1 Tax=unclassified Microbacterium TaxID=2609290 RepID=UPI00214AE38A|nr:MULTISPECIES: Stk1 family PASTA domain-containing Ser/Thr kinase [unclassified Microbacterium]MCR2783043.1 Stk1 family PASTA domain-containing Ser/Thr kinase [Microbacterium sp. zg.B96]WIM16071.1 Stk1 family PASTA domain-containing Ser/Thr kinase [Microbacterium sp. zg-B96]
MSVSAEPRVLSGRYRIDELIGRGGMARVYRGYDLTLGRPVAIKILKRDLAEDSAFRTRFRLEAQAASRMSHPTIVRVYDAGEDSETDADGSVHPVPYIVMELVQGALLKDLIADGPLPATTAVRYVDGILEALEYSHRAGVVHRDIKPGNVMVTEAGQVKVMDFGIARAVSDSSSTVADTTAILGTAAYFSPEQAKGEPVDARADVYSTGVVLYELLTGRQPFRGETPVAVAYQHVSETPVPPSEVNPDVPRGLDAVVLRALAKDPFQRFQDAAGFREALDATVDGKTPSKRQVGALTNQLYGPDPRQAQDTARSLRQLSTDTTMTRTQSGPPVAWIWAGVALLAVLLVSVLFWVVTIQPGSSVPDNARIVPDVVDMAYDRAEELLVAEELEPDRIEEASDDIAAGNVIRTEPQAGTSMAIGEKVNVYVSTGIETTSVPPLVGLDRAAAEQALTAAGLRMGIVTARNDPAAAEGFVLSASQPEGTQVPTGTAVDLEVATGRVTLVDVSGYRLDAAVRELESDEMQFTVVTVEDPSCPATPGEPTVARQSVAPGDVPIHSTVELTYCTGE